MLAGDPAAAAATLAEAETSEPAHLPGGSEPSEAEGSAPAGGAGSKDDGGGAGGSSGTSGGSSNWCPTLPQGYTPGVQLFQHAIMNLPASAIEFLDAYNGAFDPAVWSEATLPTIHCYTFMKSPEVEAGEAVFGRVQERFPLCFWKIEISKIRDLKRFS